MKCYVCKHCTHPLIFAKVLEGEKWLHFRKGKPSTNCPCGCKEPVLG